jgi:asparagine synthase (glutamine-hydrolysing)
MCGIAGFSGRFDRQLLNRMSQAVAHRGPDGTGSIFLADQGIGLAHRRLSIIDLSQAGAQPMWDASHACCITFNGEIYNFRELRAGLESVGLLFRGQSDTEVLINLYMKHGADMLAMLNGIFALAIWDGRNRELLIARDGMGVKPLYCAQAPGGFLFASEIKALLECKEIDRSIDPGALLSHLKYLWSPAPRTILKSVNKLEPGMALRVAEGRILSSWPHYKLPADRAPSPITEGDGVEQVRTAVYRAVKRQMVADVPVGAFLSGGLDSSAVVAAARAAEPQQRLQCFTIGYDEDSARREGMTQDLPFARRVAKYLDVDLHEIHVGAEMADELMRMIYQLDEPQADPAPINVMLISRLARAHGIKVLLSGTGGDDLFTGYRRHYALMLERYWSWLPRPVRAAMTRLSGAVTSRSATLRRLRKAMQYAELDQNDRIVSYFNWISPVVARDLLDGPGDEAFDPLGAALGELPESVPDLNRMLFLECRYFLADHNLNYTDKMSMSCGVEVRVPLLDPEIVDLAFRLPLHLKQRGSQGKWVFKKAMEGILPADVIYRPKTGFGAPFRAWLHGPLKSLFRDTLSEAAIRRRGLFNPRSVTRLIELDRTGRVDAGYTLLALLCVEIWCRIFLDGEFTKHRRGRLPKQRLVADAEITTEFVQPICR